MLLLKKLIREKKNVSNDLQPQFLKLKRHYITKTLEKNNLYTINPL